MMSPFINEILITVIGGVMTALVLSLFSKRTSQKTIVHHQPAPEPRKQSSFGQFIHLLFAVIGGIMLSLFASRFLFKSGILERALPTRIVILVIATAFVWWVLLLFRGKK